LYIVFEANIGTKIRCQKGSIADKILIKWRVATSLQAVSQSKNKGGFDFPPWSVDWLLLGVSLEVTLNQAGNGYVTGENVEAFEQGVIGSNQSSQGVAPSHQQGS
jgi:hypothetical protein|tara:strand:- start:10333 stop:10647 length:315 start_codon:yes stop_codon:yes gene_type:complete